MSVFMNNFPVSTVLNCKHNFVLEKEFQDWLITSKVGSPFSKIIWLN